MKKEVNLFQKIISSVLIILGIVLILFINNNITGRAIGTNQDTSLTITEIIVILWASLMIIIGIWIGIKKQDSKSIIPHQ
jgi:NADH:ubiquinone oxidoreductase subunit 2 (subunit N)